MAVSVVMTGATDKPVTAEDIAWLNGRLLLRSAAFARYAGVGLVIVGAIGALAWLWATVRLQQDGGQTGVFIIDQLTAGGEGLSFLDRLDLLGTWMRDLVLSALTIGAGLGLRLAADTAEDRVGASPGLGPAPGVGEAPTLGEDPTPTSVGEDPTPTSGEGDESR